jgi:hypothetical protein
MLNLKHVMLPRSCDILRDFIYGFTPEEQERIFLAGSGSTDIEAFRYGNTDFFYVPASQRKFFMRHSRRSQILDIWHEIGVSIIMDAMPDVEEAVGAALWRVEDPADKFALYNPCFDFFHKVKPSNPRAFKAYVRTIMQYGQMINRWDCGRSGREGLTSYDLITRTGREGWGPGTEYAPLPILI